MITAIHTNILLDIGRCRYVGVACGVRLQRTRILADFLIGSHAQDAAVTRILRGRGPAHRGGRCRQHPDLYAGGGGAVAPSAGAGPAESDSVIRTATAVAGLPWLRLCAAPPD